MNERIEAFLHDVLALEGEISSLIREGVRRRLAVYERQFRDDEPVIPENYIRTDSRGSAESAHDPTRCAWS